MRRVVDPNKIEEKGAEDQAPLLKITSMDVDLKDLLDRTKVILYRQILKLSAESNDGILSKPNSDALVNYIKLLQQMVKEEKEFLESLSDGKIEELLNKK